ncbi:MAG: NAD-dependent epimerase/dehydratase family protein [Pirellulales bacterium]
MAGEQALVKFAERMPITILRPPMVLGPGDKTSLDMFRTIKKFHIHAMPGRGRNEYAWVDARDLSTAMIVAAERGERVTVAGHPQGQGVYFINNVDAVKYVELGTQLAAALGGVKYLRIPIPGAVATRVAKWGTAMAAQSGKNVPYLNPDKAREITAGNWSSSSQKLRTKLGYQTPVAPQDRLREIAEWYRNKGWL